MRQKASAVLGFVAGLILCATAGFADDNSGFFGRYDLQFSIEDCSSHSFALVLGDDMSLVNGFGGDPDLAEYYVYIPAAESSATYTFVDAEGDTLERTVSISGDNITMHEELQGYYTGHFVFTFSADRNSFTISGNVDEQDPEAECEGAVSGSGARINPCECDLNADGRCDMRDWLVFGQRWGATNCSTAYCACDLNADGRCDMRDWLIFGQDWGRTDCPAR